MEGEGGENASETSQEMPKNSSVVENKEAPPWTKNLISKKNIRSKVWVYFGFKPDEFGLIDDRERPICRLCAKQVLCSEGSTSNMFMHVKSHHPAEYDLIVDPNKKPERKKNITINMSDEVEEPVVLIMKKGAKSPVWQYFGYRVDDQGKLADRDYPTCVLCKIDIVSKGGSTGNMRQHLRIHHPEEYNQCLEAKSDTKGKETILFDKIPRTFQEFSGTRPYQMYEKLRKNAGRKSLVWSFFGYPKSTKGTTETFLNVNMPACLLCNEQCETIDGDDSNLLSHLKENHIAEFSRFPHQEAHPFTSGAILMKKNAHSPVWMFYGYKPDEEGKPDDISFPICILCKKHYSYPNGSTTSLLRHLQRAHPAEYGICMEAGKDSGHSELLPRRKESLSKGKADQEKDGLKLIPKLNTKSPVWQYYGFRSQSSNRDRPTCQLCEKDVSASEGSTTNLLKHLKVHHPDEFNNCLHSEKYKMKPVYVSFLRKAEKVHISDHDPSLDVSTLLPKRNAKSTVWQFFGYRPNPRFPKVPQNKNKPTCRICKQDVSAVSSNTSNLLSHLSRNHLAEFRKCMKSVCENAASPPSQEEDSRPTSPPSPEVDSESTLPPSPEVDSEPTSPSSQEVDSNQSSPPSQKADSKQTSSPSSPKPFTCNLCEKTVTEEDMVSQVPNANTADKSQDSTCCWDCFAAQLEDVGKVTEQEQYDTVEFELVELDEEEIAGLNKDVDEKKEKGNKDKGKKDKKRKSSRKRAAENDSDEDYMDGIEVPPPKSRSKTKGTSWKYLPLDEKTGKSLVLLFFGYPHARNDNKTGAVCLLCKKGCEAPSSEGDTTNLLHHLKDEHPDEYRLCHETLSGTCAKKYVMKNDNSPTWLFCGFEAGDKGEPRDLNIPVCLLCRTEFKGANSFELYHHMVSEHPQEGQLCEQIKAGQFDKQYTHCWNTIRYGIVYVKPQPPSMVSLPASEGATTSSRMVSLPVSEGGTTSRQMVSLPVSVDASTSSRMVSLPASVDAKTSSRMVLFPGSRLVSLPIPGSTTSKPIPAKLSPNNPPSGDICYSCHGCEKELIEIEMINDQRAGASTPQGELDYEYCWNCFAKLKNIGSTEGSDDMHDFLDERGIRSRARRRVNSKDTGPPYICKTCNNLYSCFSHLKKHIYRCHTHNKRYICSKCPKAFTWMSELKEHELTHDGKRYPCKYCGKDFIQRRHRRLHEMIHSGEKPHMCSVCGKCFTQKVTLVSHERVHSGEKPFPCKICGWKFAQSSGRNNHEKMCTGVHKKKVKSKPKHYC